ncbi:MAG: hypothetical protein WCW14_04125 [Candidatus Paceibacterota bacterium]
MFNNILVILLGLFLIALPLTYQYLEDRKTYGPDENKGKKKGKKRIKLTS